VRCGGLRVHDELRLHPPRLCIAYCVAGCTAEAAAELAGAWSAAGPRLLAVAHSHPLPVVAPVVDAEWRFGVTVSTDDVAKVGATFLHLRLVVEGEDGRLQAVVMEAGLSQFYTLLAQLERAKSYVDFLSGVGTSGGGGGK